MAYEIDDSTARWAERRVQQLEDARYEIGAAIERLEGVPDDLRGGAYLMEDQPESETMRDFAKRIERITWELRTAFKAAGRDCKAIRKAIIKYEKGVS